MKKASLLGLIGLAPFVSGKLKGSLRASNGANLHQDDAPRVSDQYKSKTTENIVEQAAQTEENIFWERHLGYYMSYPNAPSSPVTYPTYYYYIPTAAPSTLQPTKAREPSQAPSIPTTGSPTPVPTQNIFRTSSPTQHPTPVPTQVLLQPPTSHPTKAVQPTHAPTNRQNAPSAFPTNRPSQAPTTIHPLPSSSPSTRPQPTQMPTNTLLAPSALPTSLPSQLPTIIQPVPTSPPSARPTIFQTVLSLLNQTGVCGGGVSGIGCADLTGNGTQGNPNDLVNCFNISDFGGTAPFFVDSVRFWTGQSIPLPSDLNIRIWDRSVGGTPTGNPIITQAIFNYTIGENNFKIDPPVQITTDNVCIGLYSATIADGLRIRAEPGTGADSFARSPACGANQFTQLTSLGLKLNFCIEAHVFQV